MLSVFLNKFKRKDFPDCWKNYLKNFEVEKNYSIPISNARFTVLDVESNGLNPKHDKILSIGAVKIYNNEIDIADVYEVYIDQEEFNPESAPIHGILKNGGAKKISEQDALKGLVAFISGDVIVGHRIVFDISIINETLKRYVGEKLLNKTIDTMNLYKRFKGADFKVGESVSLDKLSDEFNIPKNDRHNAAGDALITALLFLKLAARLKRRGVETLGDLLRVKNSLF